jgi:RNA polymerase sigma factor (sigma-70 family)
VLSPGPPANASAAAGEDDSSDATRAAPVVATEADRRRLLATLMRRHGDEIFRFCASMLDDRALADDVHQSVFVDAFESLATLTDLGKARAWLYGIARHRCLDAAKARRRWNFRFVLAPDAGHREPARTEELPELAQAPRLSAMLDCLRGLAPHVRVAILLRYEEGLPYEEIARMSREKAATLQARVSRGLIGLRACMGKKFGALASHEEPSR